MIRIENIRMRGKLALVLALPVLALLLFSARLIWQEWHSRGELEYLARAGELANAITGLVHALQTERGRGVAYLAAGQGHGHDAESVRALKQARDDTDAAWPTLRQAWERNADQGFDPAVPKRQQAGLERLRAQIDDESIDQNIVIDAYSELVRELLADQVQLVGHAEDPVIVRMLDAQRLLALAKEAAGAERAEGGRLIGDEDAGTVRFHKLATAQSTLLDQVMIMTPDSIRRAWNTAQRAECVHRLETLRGALVVPGGARAVSLADWFDTASCRIEKLREIEIALAEQLRVVIDQRIEQGAAHLASILTLTLLPVLPSLALIMLVGRNVTGTTRWLVNAMHGIAGGNFNVSLPPRSRDELGRLAAGLDELRGQLASFVAEQQRLLAQERHNAEILERRGQEIRLFAQRMATGDLRGRLVEGDDAFGQLAASLNQMAEGLAGLAGRVRGGSIALATTVRQMQGAIGAQSSGASEQASSVTETVTTLEQIRATSAQTLDKAQRLGEMSEKARAEGERGRHAVEAGIAGIGEVSLKVDVIAHTILSLNKWTQRIGEITGAVNDIARHLRLLSLNAAIEATKAGEAGQGFAVVAGEVKQLAEQSQSATEQVRRILEEIRHSTDRAVMATEDGSKGVARGLILVESAGSVIRGLEEVVRDTSMASRQIVAAVRQEAAGIEQIATAMNDIQKVTGQFVAATEETRRASAELGHLASRLDATAGLYRT